MKKILLVILMGMSLSANAEIMSCVGSAEDGIARVVLDMNTSTIHFNGNSHYYESKTKDGKGVCTEDYTNKHGEKIYMCIWIDSYKKIHLLGFDVNPNKLSMHIDLSCHVEN